MVYRFKLTWIFFQNELSAIYFFHFQSNNRFVFCSFLQRTRWPKKITSESQNQCKKVVTPEAKRKAIEHLQKSFGQSLRKLCVLIGLNRSSWYYQPQPDKNELIRKRLWELADERKRWGYRRLHYLLFREGFTINHKRTERLYREENLMLRVRRRKKMASESRVDHPTPERRNHCWAMDFMSDNL